MPVAMPMTFLKAPPIRKPTVRTPILPGGSCRTGLVAERGCHATGERVCRRLTFGEPAGGRARGPWTRAQADSAVTQGGAVTVSLLDVLVSGRPDRPALDLPR